jgi:hypothetical protein
VIDLINYWVKKSANWGLTGKPAAPNLLPFFQFNNISVHMSICTGELIRLESILGPPIKLIHRIQSSKCVEMNSYIDLYLVACRSSTARKICVGREGMKG